MRVRGVITLLALALCASAASAQDYRWGIGLRAGAATSGVNAKVNFDPSNTLEMLLGLNREISFYALYERRIPVIARGTSLFYGAGGHLGERRTADNEITAGVDAVIGLEYSLRQYPVAFASDYRPGFNFTGRKGFKMEDIGFSLRYTF